MASNKKINVPITSMPSGKIYTLLDTIESDGKEDIGNLMSYSDTEFIDESLIENDGSKSDLSLSTSCLDIENHLCDSNTPTPIEAVVRISQPDSDSDDDVPLNSLQVPKADKEWKWKKQFKRAYVEKCLCRGRYSQYWRPRSITNASICKNGGPRRVAFVAENRIGEIR